MISPTALLREMFDRAVAVADPIFVVPTALPPKPDGRVLVIGAGKASARMAEAVEQHWGKCEGLVITRYGYARPCAGIRIVEAAHPVPDQAGLAATQEILELVSGLSEEDFVLALISGGASALLTAPAGEITLQEKQAMNTALLASGAPIDQMNTLRKHLSRVKGGQLAAAIYPAKLLCLMISDVPGDDPAFIGSGPTIADASTSTDGLAIVKRWGVDLPAAARAVLEGGSSVVSPDDIRLSTTCNRIIAAPSQSLTAAAKLAQAAGCVVEMLGDALEGEARDIAAEHANLALARQAKLRPGDAPVVLLSGGELTVTRRGNGIGGPNAEYALALAIALGSAPGIHAIACDTDGVDGAAEVAGAIVMPKTLINCARQARKALAQNDSHGFFATHGGQVIPGPTLTNVNDFRAILLEANA